MLFHVSYGDMKSSLGPKLLIWGVTYIKALGLGTQKANKPLHVRNIISSPWILTLSVLWVTKGILVSQLHVIVPMIEGFGLS